MTKNDDVKLNLGNPLFMRSTHNGGEQLSYFEVDTNLLHLMRWAGNWSANRLPYLKNEVVSDDGWLVIANKDTSDTAAPQNSGPSSWSMVEDPGFVEQTHTGVVWSGHTFTLTHPGFFRGIQVYVPFLSGTTNYRFLIGDLTDPANPIWSTMEEPILVENGWAYLAIGNTPREAGSVFAIVIDALDSGSGSIVTGGWNRIANTSTDADPGAGNWSTNNAETRCRISATDLDSGDRISELLGVVPGSLIQIVQTDNPAKSITFNVAGAPEDNTTWVGWDVVLDSTGAGGQPDIGATTTITVDVPVPSPTRYVEAPSHYPANNPSWATVEGFLQFDGVDQPGAATSGFGVRVEFQPAYVSPDWDYLGGSGSGGSGSGSGGGVINITAHDRVRIAAFNHNGGDIPPARGFITSSPLVADTTAAGFRGSFFSRDVDALLRCGVGDFVEFWDDAGQSARFRVLEPPIPATPGPGVSFPLLELVESDFATWDGWHSVVIALAP